MLWQMLVVRHHCKFMTGGIFQFVTPHDDFFISEILVQLVIVAVLKTVLWCWRTQFHNEPMVLLYALRNIDETVHRKSFFFALLAVSCTRVAYIVCRISKHEHDCRASLTFVLGWKASGEHSMPFAKGIWRKRLTGLPDSSVNKQRKLLDPCWVDKQCFF